MRKRNELGWPGAQKYPAGNQGCGEGYDDDNAMMIDKELLDRCSTRQAANQHRL